MDSDNKSAGGPSPRPVDWQRVLATRRSRAVEEDRLRFETPAAAAPAEGREAVPGDLGL